MKLVKQQLAGHAQSKVGIAQEAYDQVKSLSGTLPLLAAESKTASEALEQQKTHEKNETERVTKDWADKLKNLETRINAEVKAQKEVVDQCNKDKTDFDNNREGRLKKVKQQYDIEKTKENADLLAATDRRDRMNIALQSYNECENALWSVVGDIMKPFTAVLEKITNTFDIHEVVLSGELKQMGANGGKIHATINVRIFDEEKVWDIDFDLTNVLDFFKQIWKFFHDLFERITGFLKGATGIIRDAGNELRDGVSTVLDGIKDGLLNGPRMQIYDPGHGVFGTTRSKNPRKPTARNDDNNDNESLPIKFKPIRSIQN